MSQIRLTPSNRATALPCVILVAAFLLTVLTFSLTRDPLMPVLIWLTGAVLACVRYRDEQHANLARTECPKLD